MKAFRFRLDRILNLRARTERERARLLQQAIRDEDERRSLLEEAQARLGRCGEQIADAGAGVTTVGTIRNLGLTMEAAVDDVEVAEASHLTAEEAVHTEQEMFAEARKDRRIVERLRERRHSVWSVETSRAEQRQLDAISHRRRVTEGEK